MTARESSEMEGALRQIQRGRGITCAYHLTSWASNGQPDYAWSFRTERLQQPIVFHRLVTEEVVLEKEALAYARQQHSDAIEAGFMTLRENLLAGLAATYRKHLLGDTSEEVPAEIALSTVAPHAIRLTP